MQRLINQISSSSFSLTYTPSHTHTHTHRMMLVWIGRSRGTLHRLILATKSSPASWRQRYSVRGRCHRGHNSWVLRTSNIVKYVSMHIASTAHTLWYPYHSYICISSVLQFSPPLSLSLYRECCFQWPRWRSFPWGSSVRPHCLWSLFWTKVKLIIIN